MQSESDGNVVRQYLFSLRPQLALWFASLVLFAFYIEICSVISNVKSQDVILRTQDSLPAASNYSTTPISASTLDLEHLEVSHDLLETAWACYACAIEHEGRERALWRPWSTKQILVSLHRESVPPPRRYLGVPASSLHVVNLGNPCQWDKVVVGRIAGAAHGAGEDSKGLSNARVYPFVYDGCVLVGR